MSAWLLPKSNRLEKLFVANETSGDGAYAGSAPPLPYHPFEVLAVVGQCPGIVLLKLVVGVDDAKVFERSGYKEDP
jgi:hypothetical protein